MNINKSSAGPNAPKTVKSFGKSAHGDLTRLLNLLDPNTVTVSLERVEGTSLVAHLTAYNAIGAATPAGVELKSKIANHLGQASSDDLVTRETLHKQLIAFARVGSYTTQSATTYGRLGLCVLESLGKEVGRFHFEFYRGVGNLVHITFGGFDYQWSAILREMKDSQPMLCDSLSEEACVKLQLDLETSLYDQSYQAPELEYDERVDGEWQGASTDEEPASSVDGRADSAIATGSPVQEKQQEDISITAGGDATSDVNATLSSKPYTASVHESTPDQPTTTEEVPVAAEGKKRKRSDDDATEGVAGSAKVPRKDSYRGSDVVDSVPTYESPHAPAGDASTTQAAARESIDLTSSETQAPSSSTHAAETASDPCAASVIDLTSNSTELNQGAALPTAVQSAILGGWSLGKNDGKARPSDDAQLFGAQNTGDVEGISSTAHIDQASPATFSTSPPRKRKAEDDGGQASKRRASEAGRSKTIQSSATGNIEPIAQGSREVDNSNQRKKIRRKPKQRKLSAPFKQCLVNIKWYEEDYTLKKDDAKVAITADKKYLNFWQDAEEPFMSILTASIKNLEYAQNKEDLVLSRDGEKTLILAIDDEYMYSRTHDKFYNELEPLANDGEGTERLQKARAEQAARKTVNETSHNASFMRQQWKTFGNGDWRGITKNDMKQFCRWVDETHAEQPFRGFSNRTKTETQGRIIEWLTMNPNEGADAASAAQATRPQWKAKDENGRVLGYYHTYDEARLATQEAIFAAAAARSKHQ